MAKIARGCGQLSVDLLYYPQVICTRLPRIFDRPCSRQTYMRAWKGGHICESAHKNLLKYKENPSFRTSCAKSIC